jgi:hypothetical protein
LLTTSLSGSGHFKDYNAEYRKNGRITNVKRGRGRRLPEDTEIHPVQNVLGVRDPLRKDRQTLEIRQKLIDEWFISKMQNPDTNGGLR